MPQNATLAEAIFSGQPLGIAAVTQLVQTLLPELLACGQIQALLGSLTLLIARGCNPCLQPLPYPEVLTQLRELCQGLTTLNSQDEFGRWGLISRPRLTMPITHAAD
jgi:hypothetical protein